MLHDIPDNVFTEAVKHCLASCKFFPTISQLGEAAYPTIEEYAPYNAFVYHEPRKVAWQEQLKREIQNPKIEQTRVKVMLQELTEKMDNG